MKKYIPLLLVPAIAGCVLFHPAERAQKKALSKAAASDTYMAEEAKSMTTAALDALQRAPTNAPVNMAKAFLERDQQILGLPVQRIDVDSLLASNRVAIDDLRRRFDVQQARFEERASIQRELKEVNDRLAEMGKLYEQEKAKHVWRRIWEWAIGTLGFGGLIAIVIFCPVVIPIIGSLFGSLVSSFPQIGHFIGLVSKPAADAVIKGIGEARAKLKLTADVAPEKTYTAKDALALLDSELKEATEVGSANFKKFVDFSRQKLNV